MANKFLTNVSLASSNDNFHVMWATSRVMKAAGWNVMAHSNGTTKVADGTNANDGYWGNNSDPLTDTYPVFAAAAAWIVLRGPTTLKINLAAAPTPGANGDFVRGEIVTQTTSGATGILSGYVWDSSLLQGWAVIEPCTGTFDGTNNITGSISGAIATVNSIKFFTREVMFAKSSANQTDGTIYYVCADGYNEHNQLFSGVKLDGTGAGDGYLAQSTGCTASVAPGKGGTGNTFPSRAINLRGATSSTTHSVLFSNYGLVGRLQALAVNAVPSTGVSADGSFWMAASNNGTTNGFSVIGFTKLIDCEPGDIDPYIWFAPSGTTVWTWTQTTTLAPSGTTYVNSTTVLGSTQVYWLGYLARDGYSTRDKVTYYRANVEKDDANVATIYGVNGLNQRIANHPSPATAPLLRYHFSFVYYNSTTSEFFYKGKPKWMFCLSQGSGLDTSDSKQFICVAARIASSQPAMYIGPYDGTTTPLI